MLHWVCALSVLFLVVFDILLYKFLQIFTLIFTDMAEDMPHEKVCSWDSACVIILIIHLQTTPEHCDMHCDQDCYDDDPVINIHFSSEAEIDNCLSLATISTVGPNNDVPRLARGIVSTTI